MLLLPFQAAVVPWDNAFFGVLGLLRSSYRDQEWALKMPRDLLLLVRALSPLHRRPSTQSVPCMSTRFQLEIDFPNAVMGISSPVALAQNVL